MSINSKQYTLDSLGPRLIFGVGLIVLGIFGLLYNGA